MAGQSERMYLARLKRVVGRGAARRRLRQRATTAVAEVLSAAKLASAPSNFFCLSYSIRSSEQPNEETHRAGTKRSRGQTHVAPEGVLERVARHRQRCGVLVALLVERARRRRIVCERVETQRPLLPFHLCLHPAVQVVAPGFRDQARAGKIGASVIFSAVRPHVAQRAAALPAVRVAAAMP
jgi:hypothetical protein